MKNTNLRKRKYNPNIKETGYLLGGGAVWKRLERMEKWKWNSKDEKKVILPWTFPSSSNSGNPLLVSLAYHEANRQVFFRFGHKRPADTQYSFLTILLFTPTIFIYTTARSSLSRILNPKITNTSFRALVKSKINFKYQMNNFTSNLSVESL